MAASQVETLRLFTALLLYRESWAGALLLSVGLNDTGRASALASLAAGAAALLLEADPKLLREASREGCATFTVTTLDEALRALKNEVRKGRAITVALSGDPAQHVAEMVERGVLPDAIAVATSLPEEVTHSMTALVSLGTQPLGGLGLKTTRARIDLAEVLEPFAASQSCKEHFAATLPERRAQDALLLDRQLADDARAASINRRWLQAAPTLFPRALSRAVWMKR